MDLKKKSKLSDGFSDQIARNFAISSFPASGDFCRLLIAFANSLDPDQARQNDRKGLTLDGIPERSF